MFKDISNAKTPMFLLIRNILKVYNKYYFTCKMISPLSGAFTERLGNSISSTLSGKTEKTQNYQQNKIFKRSN